MNKIYTWIFLVFCSVSVFAQDPVEIELAEKLQFTLDSAVEKMKLTGVSANITMPDGKVWNATSGYADPYDERRIGENELFWSGSICKMFTGGVIFQLAEEGKLSLEDKIGKYFNDIQYVDTNVTIRELVKHRSGIAEVLSQTATSQWYNNPNKMWSKREVLDTYLKPKSFNHGAGFEYSNSNFILLAMVVEKVTGNSFAQELNTRFFGPLGMNRSYFLPQDQPLEPTVTCWSDFNQDGEWDDQSNFIHSKCFSTMVSGAGAMLSQPADISKYTRALYSGQLTSDTTLDQMKQCTNVSFGPNCNGYGMSTMRYSYFGKNWFGHGGDISGFTTMTVHQKESNITLTLMINQDLQNRALLASALIKKLNFITTGIEENVQDLTRIIQNPVKDKLFVEVGTAKPIQAEIRSVDGKLINAFTLIPGRNEVDICDLETGVYQLMLNAASGPVCKRFVKH